MNMKTLMQVLSVEGNHLLALPDDFDVQVASTFLFLDAISWSVSR